ncbi:MAG TPA: DPP IV N-terminal domain-containing protein [Vicinamibacterales bacterium]
MNTQYEFGPFVLDPAEGRLSRDGEVIRLTPRLLALLTVLVERQGRLVEKAELFDRVWGGTFVSEANITVQMSRLRRLLGEDEAHPLIETVPTRGYRFLMPVKVVFVDHDRTIDLQLPPLEVGDAPAREDAPARDGGEVGSQKSEVGTGSELRGQKPEAWTHEVRAEIPRGTKGQSAFWWRAGLVLTGVLLVGLVFWLAPSPRSSASASRAGETRLTNHLADDGEPAWSPDGTTLAFVSNRGGPPELHLLDLATGKGPMRLSPSVAGSPAWSPDGTHLAFACLRSGQWDICVIDRDGRRERVVVSSPVDETEPAWSPDSARLAFRRADGRRGEIHVTDASGGGASRPVTPPDWSAERPSWSPDGRRLVVSRHVAGEDFDLAIVDVSASGHANGGGPAPIVLSPSPGGNFDPVWSRDGARIAFAHPNGVGILDVADGSVTFLDGSQAGDRYPTWSPDGGAIAFQSGRDGNREIYRAGVGGARVTRRLTDSLAADQDPAWSPDGRRIAFAANRDGQPEIYVMNADGTGVERLTTNAFLDLKPVWSPDGRQIAFMREEDGRYDIYVMDLATKRERRLEGTAANDSEPSWSPDGRRIAFNSPATGNFDIYVMDVESGTPRNVTNHPARDTYPSWSPDGRALVFASNRESTDFFDNDLYILDLETGATRRITSGPAWDAFPVWSRTGRIAFVRSVARRHDLMMYDVARGTEIPLTVGGADEDGPSWSPDGRQVAYFSNLSGNADIYVRDAPP